MNLLLRVLKWLMFLSSLFLVLALSLTVLFRYVLKMDLFGIGELVIIPMFLMYFCGAVFASFEKSHISANILDSYITNKKMLLTTRIFTNLVSVAATGIFSFWSFQYFIWSFTNTESTSGWNIPLYIPHGIVMIGFMLMSLYLLISLWHQLQMVLGKKEMEA